MLGTLPQFTIDKAVAVPVEIHALGTRVVRALRPRVALLPFQNKWIERAFDEDVQVAAWSLPRGSGKTFLAGHLAALSITPGSPLWQERVEVLAVSASLEQSRIMLNFVREALGDRQDDYRFLESGQRLAVTHKATGTRLRILSSSGKRAMGLAQFSTIFADEPAAWEARGGALMWDALRTSLGKLPGQRVVLIGTRAPAEVGSWWPELLEAGSGEGTFIEVMAAPDALAWDSWEAITTANPLVRKNPELRKTILRERGEARRNETLRPAYEAYRLNRMVDTSSEVLLTVETWKRVEARPPPPRSGRPILGLDLGAERSWSAAWAIWPNGRSEVYAVCPGIPDLAERERQDAMPAGLYRRFVDDGVLLIDEGLRMSRPETLVNHLLQLGIRPEAVYCDRFIVGALLDAIGGRWPVLPRVARWSDATEDIAGLRKLAGDGPLSIVPECRGLARLGLWQATVHSDDQGSVRLAKKRNRRSRDDVAAAGVLAVGAMARSINQPRRRGRIAFSVPV